MIPGETAIAAEMERTGFGRLVAIRRIQQRAGLARRGDAAPFPVPTLEQILAGSWQ